tara:strand:+ start:7103 stop:7390 length:288 start_codon:yes stop_codon:yes gene_type:complete
MTYVYEYVVGNDNVKVEYCHSSISDEIKVVDMWVNGKFHRTNWMSPEGNKALMARLEKDMEDRMCGTLDDMTVGGYNGFDTELDLDRDIPEIAIA